MLFDRLKKERNKGYYPLSVLAEFIDSHTKVDREIAQKYTPSSLFFLFLFPFPSPLLFFIFPIPFSLLFLPSLHCFLTTSCLIASLLLLPPLPLPFFNITLLIPTFLE